MLIPSDLMVLGTRYYHEFGLPSYCALQHRAHNSFLSSSSIQGLRFPQQQTRSSGFGKGSAGSRWEVGNMQRVVGRHRTLKLNQILLVGLQPAYSAQPHHGWRSLGFKRNFALQTMDSYARSLIGSSDGVLGSRPRGQNGGNGGSSARISCSSVPRVRPAVAHRSFRESRKLVTRKSRQQRSTSNRIGSTGDFSAQRLLECAVDVLRNFNEKVNSLFQREGGGSDSQSRDFATAAERKSLRSDENAIREENVSPELVDVVSKQEQGSEFEWRSALWEAEVSLVEESEEVAGSGAMISLGGTDIDTLQQVSSSNVPESALGDAEKFEGTTPAAISAGPELQSPKNGSAVPIRTAHSSLEREEVDTLPVKEESEADSRSGLVSGLGTDGHTSSQLSVFDVPESTSLGEAADVEIRADDKIEEATLTGEANFENRELDHHENRVVVSSIQQEVSSAEIEETQVWPEVSRTDVIFSGADGDISQLGGSIDPESALSEANVEIQAEETIEEAMRAATAANRHLEHTETGNMGRTVQVSESASLVDIEVAEGKALNEADVKVRADEKFEESMAEAITADRELELSENVEVGSTLHGSDGAPVEVNEVDIGELWNRNSSGYSSFAGFEPSLSRELRAWGSAEDSESLAADVSVENGETVESSSFGGQTTLAGEAGAMEEVKPILEDFGEPFREEQDTDDAIVATDSSSTDRNIGGVDDPALQHEISRLQKSISHHAYLYHTLDSPVLSDAAYDSLVKELINLEAQVSNSETSLSDSVAAPPSPDMLKVVHSVPMLSLASVQKEEEALLWYRKLQQKLGLDRNTSGWVVEPKVDGLALSLRYDHGNLKRAATRGNGIQGEDVTHNAQRVVGIPLTIPQKLPGTESPCAVLEVRGEIFMSLKDFKELNASKIQAGEKPFANPRNAAAGSMRLLSSNSNEFRPLSFVAYSIALVEVGAEPTEEDRERSSLVPTNQWEVLQVLKSAGFAVNEDNRLCESFDSALEYAKSWRSTRKNLEYEADGVVLKVNDLETQCSLGSAGDNPRWALAWKFAATEAVSVLEGIELTIGRSGAMIPNARLKPVELGGAVISRASLHNFGHVKALGLCEGDHVVVQRAGDVIPQVVQVLEDLRPETATPWVPPQECPTCGSTLTEASASTMVFCSNSTCPSRHSRQVGHFAKTLISGLGSTTLGRLEEELVKEPADFYDLDEKALSKVKGFGKQSIKRLLKAIEESKQEDLWLFIAALGIPKVGTNTARELAKKFGSLQALMESDVSGFMDVPGIGAATASFIFNWCQAEPNIELVHRLKEAGCKVNGNQVTETHGEPESTEDGSITPDVSNESEGEPDVVEDLKEDTKATVSDVVEGLEEVIEFDESGENSGDLKKNDEAVDDVTSQPSTPLSGKSIVITGDFGTLKRKEMKKLVALHGGVVRSSVTSRTSFVLRGNRPGPLKVAEASRRGVEMLDLQGFLSLIGQAESDIV